ncbi:hypothetical protein D3C81_1082470 [compost metagenome]
MLSTGVEQRLVLGHEGWQVIGDQPQIAHGGANLQRFHAPFCQLEEHGWVTLCRQQANLEQRVRPLGMLQVQTKTLHATIAPGQERAQVVEHSAQRKQQGLVRLNVEVQLQACFEAVRWLVEIQPQAAQAEQLVQVQLDLGRKAFGQGITRQRHDLAKLAQPHPGKGLGGLLRQPDTVDGHARQHRARLFGTGHCQAIVAVGEHACRHWVTGQHDALTQAQLAEFLTQACLEQRPGAKQLQAGAYFQQQRPWVMQAHLRAEAVGPGRQ